MFYNILIKCATMQRISFLHIESLIQGKTCRITKFAVTSSKSRLSVDWFRFVLKYRVVLKVTYSIRIHSNTLDIFMQTVRTGNLFNQLQLSLWVGHSLRPFVAFYHFKTFQLIWNLYFPQLHKFYFSLQRLIEMNTKSLLDLCVLYKKRVYK